MKLLKAITYPTILILIQSATYVWTDTFLCRDPTRTKAYCSEDMGSFFEEELGYRSYVQFCLIQIMTDAGKPDSKGIYTCGMTDLNSCCKPDFKTPTSTVEKSIYNRSCSTVPSIGH
ncbi:hypothetical protein MJO28_010473 [Puccinia striiformis f. sp. tritici]|uniref:Uncharacterized protein n=1 Tax=Puccinia striiformis f. sp. tritici TaxID=168172 RepID=A0ACC0E6J8_9BASI|nr:hypothetical protein MJO28_010473 [Puccinia striiformis f. sp. tritici]